MSSMFRPTWKSSKDPTAGHNEESQYIERVGDIVGLLQVSGLGI
jgi:hypothetical protein